MWKLSESKYICGKLVAVGHGKKATINSQVYSIQPIAATESSSEETLSCPIISCDNDDNKVSILHMCYSWSLQQNGYTVEEYSL